MTRVREDSSGLKLLKADDSTLGKVVLSVADAF
jgi:hypothetical protein